MKAWPLKVLGLSYRGAPVELRERFYKEEHEITQLLLQLKEMCGIEEAMILSTCHRTEFYYVSESVRRKEIAALLCLPQLEVSEEGSIFYEKNETAEAIQHLFSVAVGMDSQVIGEQHIFHQIKRAYQLSVEVELAGAYLHRLMHSVFYAHKCVSKQTAWYQGSASIAQASIHLLRSLIQGRRQMSLLILGAGEMGKETARDAQYVDEIEKVYIASRNFSKAEALAQAHAHKAVPLSEASTYAREVDIIISSLRRKEPFITHEVLQKRSPSTQYLIDMSVPRSISAEVERLPGVILYNIDEIRETNSHAQEKRLASRVEVEQIIQNVQEDFLNWCEGNSFSPTIQSFKDTLEQLRKEEMARHLKTLNPQDIQQVDKMTRSLIQRIIKYPILQLKEACKRGEADLVADQLRELFDLKQGESVEKAQSKSSS